jgi:hypothetical protein
MFMAVIQKMKKLERRAGIRAIKNAYKISVKKPEVKDSLWRLDVEWKVIINVSVMHIT